MRDPERLRRDQLLRERLELAPAHRSGEPIPLSPILRELLLAGAIPRDSRGLPEFHRCLCTHVPGAHLDQVGPCQSKLCRRRGKCSSYRENPAFAFDGAPSGVTVTKLRVNEDGTLSRV